MATPPKAPSDPSQVPATTSTPTAQRLELPDAALIPARLVLNDKAFDEIVTQLAGPVAPTGALRDLMRHENR